MNLNLLSYLLFFPAMTAIAVVTAQTCHRHGRVWMLRIFDMDTAFVDAVNNVLLAGCYAVNIGYIALVMGTWEPVPDLLGMMGLLSVRIAIILFSLAGLHYMNISVLLIWSRFNPDHVVGFVARAKSAMAAALSSRRNSRSYSAESLRCRQRRWKVSRANAAAAIFGRSRNPTTCSGFIHQRSTNTSTQ